MAEGSSQRRRSRSEDDSGTSRDPRTSRPDHRRAGDDAHEAVNNRLLAVADEEGDARAEAPMRGAWLAEELKNYFETNRIDENSNPTEEEIFRQIRPHNFHEGFVDPIKVWRPVDESDRILLPAWNKIPVPEGLRSATCNS